jgi:hypothetical protein
VKAACTTWGDNVPTPCAISDHNTSIHDINVQNYLPWVFLFFFFLPPGLQPSTGYGLLVSWGFSITHDFAIVGRTPLDEWSAHRRDLYQTTHNEQTSMFLVGFEPTIAVGERTYTYALDRVASGTSSLRLSHSVNILLLLSILKKLYTC